MATHEERVEAGKRAKRGGQRFENDVREDLQNKGWLVFKNDHKVINGEFKKAPHYYNVYRHMMTQGQGFPDFICVKAKERYVMFVESKKNKYLDQEEKEMVKWIHENLDIPVQIAYKNKILGEIEYKDA